jgi:two-component system response regulator YesN
VLGPSVRRLSELQKSYRAAQKVFSMRFFYNTPNVLVLYSDTDFSKSRINFSPLLDIDSEKLDWTVMERFLKMGTIREIPDYITEFLDSLGTNNLKLSALKRYIVMDIYFCCLTFLQHLGYKKEELTALTSTADLSFAPGTIRPTLEEILTTTLGYRNDRTENRNTKLISKVKDFIQHNYSTDITLNLVAKEAGISPNYLSTLFSTETNKTFIEYLTSVRLEKATELLMCTPMRSSEISYQIGYQDAHYFSYLFKKNFGISPREYRARKSKTKNADD